MFWTAEFFDLYNSTLNTLYQSRKPLGYLKKNPSPLWIEHQIEEDLVFISGPVT